MFVSQKTQVMIRLFTVCIALFFISCSINLKAASTDSTFKNQYTIYVNQPIGLTTKLRLTFECRFTPKTSVLFNHTLFYGLSPGQQGYVELRRYFGKKEKVEYTIYTKLGAGYSFGASGTYGVVGIGTGQKIYFDKDKRYSLYCVQGAKYCPTTSGSHDTAPNPFQGFFNISGPGAILDLQFNFGYRF
jgi:hypothetical protein